MLTRQSSVLEARCNLRVAPGRQRTVQALCAKAKKAAKQQKPQGVKVSPRGKVSSRPSQEQLQELYQQRQQQAAAQLQQQIEAPEQEQQQQKTAATPVLGTAAAAAGRRNVETPQAVVDRMFGRVLTFAGFPVVSALFFFPLFWYLKVVQKLEYPIWVVYVTSALAFGGGLLGITYGILSSSWDPRREGSFWGWTEFRANLAILLNKEKQE